MLVVKKQKLVSCVLSYFSNALTLAPTVTPDAPACFLCYSQVSLWMDLLRKICITLRSTNRIQTTTHQCILFVFFLSFATPKRSQNSSSIRLATMKRISSLIGCLTAIWRSDSSPLILHIPFKLHYAPLIHKSLTIWIKHVEKREVSSSILSGFVPGLWHFNGSGSDSTHGQRLLLG